MTIAKESLPADELRERLNEMTDDQLNRLVGFVDGLSSLKPEIDNQKQYLLNCNCIQLEGSILDPAQKARALLMGCSHIDFDGWRAQDRCAFFGAVYDLIDRAVTNLQEAIQS